MMIVIAVALALFVLTGCAVANRFHVPPAVEPAEIHNAAAAQLAPDAGLTITTWNVGYAGMGAESDFIFDLGKQRRPLSGQLVDRNLDAIAQELGTLDSDLILVQEAAQPSWVTYQRDVLSGLSAALPGYSMSFGADVNTRFVPPPFNVQVGNATFSRIPIEAAERRGLPLEPTFQMGIFRKGYRMHVSRIGGAHNWVIVNVHLSTFDSAEDDVRRAQVEAILEFARSEYSKGARVIVGGDWNLRLAETHFAHSTAESFQFWIRDFPKPLLPEGWSLVADPKVPSVRLAHQPYRARETYTLVIDGFLVSPNVAVQDVKTHNLRFVHSDHHPVTARFAAKNPKE